MGSKTRMMGLPGYEEKFDNIFAIWIQYSRVTDGQADRQIDRHCTTASIRAYA